MGGMPHDAQGQHAIIKQVTTFQAKIFVAIESDGPGCMRILFTERTRAGQQSLPRGEGFNLQFKGKYQDHRCWVSSNSMGASRSVPP